MLGIAHEFLSFRTCYSVAVAALRDIEAESGGEKERRRKRAIVRKLWPAAIVAFQALNATSSPGLSQGKAAAQSGRGRRARTKLRRVLVRGRGATAGHLFRACFLNNRKEITYLRLSPPSPPRFFAPRYSMKNTDTDISETPHASRTMSGIERKREGWRRGNKKKPCNLAEMHKRPA